PMPIANTVTGPIPAMGMPIAYDLPNSGKPASSAVSAHFLVSSALTSLAVASRPPRSRHDGTPWAGQLSRPKTLLSATTAAAISFATGAGSLATGPAAACAAAHSIHAIVTCMAAIIDQN